jgi:hypothetical protein
VVDLYAVPHARASLHQQLHVIRIATNSAAVAQAGPANKQKKKERVQQRERNRQPQDKSDVEQQKGKYLAAAVNERNSRAQEKNLYIKLLSEKLKRPRRLALPEREGEERENCLDSGNRQQKRKCKMRLMLGNGT